MSESGEPRPCRKCGHQLEVVRHPMRRLSWSRYWWTGFKSLFARPLLACRNCGAMFTWEGDLLALGAVETMGEVKLKALREDMINLRDAFATVTLAAIGATVWMIIGPRTFEVIAPVLSGAVAVLSAVPFVYFTRRARQVKRALRGLKDSRVKGELAE